MMRIYFSNALKRGAKVFFAIAFIFMPALIKAQGELALIDFKIKKPDRVDVVKNSEGKYIFSFLNHKQIQLTTVNQNYSFTSASFELDKSLHRTEYLIATRDVKFHTAYFYHERSKTIKAFRFNLAMGTTETLDCGVISADEDFLTVLQVNQKFYLITVSRAASVIHLWESSQGDPFVKTSFEVLHPRLNDALRSTEDQLNERIHSDIGIDKITYDLENNLKSAHALNKLYVIDGQLIITMDEPDQLWLYTINLDQKKLTEKKLAFKLEAGEGKRTNKQGNSFLYYNKLFRATSNDDMLNVVMLDVDSVKMEWNQKIFKDLPILIKNGPILSESGSNTPKVIGKTSQYLSKVQNSKIAIAVNEINDQYIIQIGSYEYKQSYGGYGNNGGGAPRVSFGIGMGMGMGMGGFGMGYPMGGGGFGGGYGWGSPGYNYGYPGYYPSNSYTYIESTYFYSLVDAITLEHVELAPPKTLREKLSDYEDQKFKSNMPDLIKVFPLEDGAILMGYYLKSAHKYQLVEIR